MFTTSNISFSREPVNQHQSFLGGAIQTVTKTNIKKEDAIEITFHYFVFNVLIILLFLFKHFLYLIPQLFVVVVYACLGLIHP